MENYFDNAATTPLDPRVLQEMLPFLGLEFGNPNSIHSYGRNAKSAVELARQRVASLIGAEDPSQITFTSGATEANNWVLARHQNAAVSPFEHSSLWETAQALGHTILPNIGHEVLARPGFDLICLMTVNNETGDIWDPMQVVQPGSRVLTDITQAAGKIPLTTKADFATFSAHKFQGPKGVGALFSKNTPPQPLIHGGEQEEGFRAGTLNVPAIVGFGVAAQIAADELDANMRHVQAVRDSFFEALSKRSNWINNAGPKASPYIASIAFPGVLGESLVIEMDRRGFAISSGAACSSRSNQPSHVLTALGYPPEQIAGTVRISFGPRSQPKTSQLLALSLLEAAENLRTMSKRTSY